MERAAAPAVAGFFTARPLAAGPRVLDEEVAHHLRVRRVAAGDAIRLTDGLGGSAVARLVSIDKRAARVEVETVHALPEPSAVHLLPPVGDRDRMLWLAEKAVELGVRGWRPVTWRRSRSVSPRGEGEAFRAKVRARMIAALEQSGGAWLPHIADEADLPRALQAVTASTRLLLDSRGTSIEPYISNADTALLAGPEGGMEEGETALATDHGFQPVALAATTLRFETAITIAVGAVRALQMGS